MASLNAAEHFGLDREIGGIAPGRWADFLVLPDPPDGAPGGGRRAEDASSPATAAASCRAPKCPCPGASTQARVRGRSILARRLAAPGPDARVRVIRVAGDIVTAEAEATLPVRDRALLADPASDLLARRFACDRRAGGAAGSGSSRGSGCARARSPRRCHSTPPTCPRRRLAGSAGGGRPSARWRSAVASSSWTAAAPCARSCRSHWAASPGGLGARAGPRARGRDRGAAGPGLDALARPLLTPRPSRSPRSRAAAD